jgi:hypothetical protein
MQQEFSEKRRGGCVTGEFVWKTSCPRNVLGKLFPVVSGGLCFQKKHPPEINKSNE